MSTSRPRLIPRFGGCSDEELVSRWSAGEARAGSELVARHRRGLHGYFALKVRESEREDLVQETFSRLTKSIHAFEARARFKTYLYRIAYNALADHLRRVYRRVPVQSLGELEPGEAAAVEELLLIDEREQQLRASVCALPPNERDYVERFYFEGVTARAIAKQQDLPEGTVRRRLHDARKLLKRDLIARRDAH